MARLGRARPQRQILLDPVFSYAVVSGTAVTGGVLESEIVAGNETILITLTNATWESGGSFNSERQNIINGLDSAQSEGTGWNAEVRDKEGVGAVVRTSATLVTITLTASGSYAVTADETITVTVPNGAVVDNSVDLNGTPTFVVTNEAVAGVASFLTLLGVS